MPTNLELLKSIYENRGEFDKYLYMIPEDNSCNLFNENGGYFSFENGIVYRIPSELEVEKKIVELLPQDKHSFRIEHKIEIREEWIYSVYYDGGYFRSASAHESRLTAGLMLWDKLLKEKR